jgi:hypothetical protein
MDMGHVSLRDKFRAALFGLWIVADQTVQAAPAGSSPQGIPPLNQRLWHQLNNDFTCPPGSPWLDWQHDLPMTADEWLVASIPNLLMWHDNAQQRHDWISTLGLSSALQDQLWLLGNILESLLGQSEISRAGGSPLHDQLSTGLGPTITRLAALTESSTLSAAWQSFLSVPENYGLAVNNALRHQGTLAAMLTGLMAGAYGGPGILPVTGLSSTPLARIDQFADQFFARWSGTVISVPQRPLSLRSQMVGALNL